MVICKRFKNRSLKSHQRLILQGLINKRTDLGKTVYLLEDNLLCPWTGLLLELIYSGNSNRFFLFFSYFLCVSFDTLFDIFIPFKCYCTQSVPKNRSCKTSILPLTLLISMQFLTILYAIIAS